MPPWEPPTLPVVYRRVKADFRANMAGSEPALWPNNLYVVTKVFAGIADAYYRRLGWMRDQRFAHKADAESLDEHAEELGITRNPPSFAAGPIVIAADIGTIIPAGTRLLRPDGEVFLTDTDLVSSDATSVMTVHAETEGALGNTEEDVPLALETAGSIVGFTSATVSGGGLSGGQEAENEASLRAKILSKKRNPAVPGSPVWYRQLAMKWPGVTRAWSFRATPSPGFVSVFFMMDDVYSDGIPSDSDVAGVSALLEAEAPDQVRYVVQAPVAQAINVTLTGLSPNTLSVQNAVKNELKSMIKRLGKPGTFEKPFVFSRSWLDEAISIAPEEDSHTMSLPAADVTFQAAISGDPPKIPTMGTVAFP